MDFLKIKILFLSYYYWPPHFGGGLLHTIERLEEMAGRGHKVEVITSGATGFPLHEINNGLTINRSKLTKHNNFLSKSLHHLVFFFGCARQLLKHQYNVVHIGSLPGNNPVVSYLLGIILLKICRLRKAKTVYLFSLADSTEHVIILDGIRGQIRKAFYKNIDSIVVNSPMLFDSMNKLFAPHVKMILNGAKDQIFKPDSILRASIRNKHGVDDQTAVFSFIGTISKRKGLDTLFAAYQKARTHLPNSALWIIGPASREENQNIGETEYNQLIKMGGLIPNVLLMGRIDDREELAGLLCASDVFVFPTRREGMPMALLQAMSSGLPVIVTRLQGITDVANIEGVTGYFIEPENEEHLSKLMVKLANEKQLRKSLGENARKRIENSFSWQNHIDEWERLYTTH